MIILADTWIMNWNFANMTTVTKSGKSTKHVLRRGQWPPRQVSSQLLFTWRLTCTLLAFPWMELLSDVLETGSSIQADRTQQVETGTGRKTANCGFHCTKFYENSFILENSGNHQHRENYKRLDIRDDVDCPILQRAVVRLLASGSRVT